VNNISKFVDGVEWFMVALHSVDRNGDINDIDPCGLMFDDSIYCVWHYILFKTKTARLRFRYITTGKNN
jgi:hypothetical protein